MNPVVDHIAMPVAPIARAGLAASLDPWRAADTGAPRKDVLTFPAISHDPPKARLNPAIRTAETPVDAPERGDGSLAPAPTEQSEQCERSERDALFATQLIEAAAGNARSFERFYDATIGYARALARRMVKTPDLDDLLADAYLQVWREAARFDAARGSAISWLLTLVRSRALDLLRRQRALRAVETDGESPPDIATELPGPDELLSATQSGTVLHAALAQLSANERWVLGLAYYAELTHREICEQTGLPLGTVKSLILRAQGKLRERLATH